MNKSISFLANIRVAAIFFISIVIYYPNAIAGEILNPKLIYQDEQGEPSLPDSPETIEALWDTFSVEESALPADIESKQAAPTMPDSSDYPDSISMQIGFDPRFFHRTQYRPPPIFIRTFKP